MEPNNYRTALYARLSKEDENQGISESITNQLALLQDFADRRQLKVCETYVDDGYSGTNFERPAFQRLLADIEAKKINLVLSKDLSRLGRDYIMTGYFLECYFPERNVRYISVLDGIDTAVECTANELTPFRAILNDMYAKDISKKIKSVKRDKQKKGQFIGGKALFGYRIDPEAKNKLIVDEQAAAVVRKIFALALEGQSCRQIAVWLNENHIPPPAVYAHLKVGRNGPYSGLWSSERIAEMLQNEMYLGHMVQGRRIKASYKSKKCLKQSPDKWIVVPNTHEPLIEPAVFQKVDSMLADRRCTRSRQYDFYLKGLIYCRECGHPLAAVNRPDSQGRDTLYFLCRTYQRFTKAKACSAHCIKEERVNQAVREIMREVCAEYIDPRFLQPMAQKVLESWAEKSEPQKQKKMLQEQIKRLSAYLDRIYRDYLQGELEKEDFRRVYRQVKEERQAAAKKLQLYADNAETAEDLADRAGRFSQKFAAEINDNREFLRSLIGRIELTQEKQLVIYFQCQNPWSDNGS